jgi:ATP-dependent DNA helicase Q1
VHFSSPLYRKNLMYKVIEKSSQGERVIEDMVDYIQTNHPNQSGIIYCYTKSVRAAEGNSNMP